MEKQDYPPIPDEFIRIEGTDQLEGFVFDIKPHPGFQISQEDAVKQNGDMRESLQWFVPLEGGCYRIIQMTEKEKDFFLPPLI